MTMSAPLADFTSRVCASSRVFARHDHPEFEYEATVWDGAGAVVAYAKGRTVDDVTASINKLLSDAGLPVLLDREFEERV